MDTLLWIGSHVLGVRQVRQMGAQPTPILYLARLEKAETATKESDTYGC